MWYWNQDLEHHMHAVMDSQSPGQKAPAPEEFLDASTDVDHIRNFVVFYHDGAQYHLTREAEYKRGRWLHSQKDRYR